MSVGQKSIIMLQLTLKQQGFELHGCSEECTQHCVIPGWLNPRILQSVYGGTAFEEGQLSAARGFPTTCRGLAPLSLAHTCPMVVKVTWVF